MARRKGFRPSAVEQNEEPTIEVEEIMDQDTQVKAMALQLAIQSLRTATSFPTVSRTIEVAREFELYLRGETGSE